MVPSILDYGTSHPEVRPMLAADARKDASDGFAGGNGSAHQD
jgi:hypothetical protein